MPAQLGTQNDVIRRNHARRAGAHDYWIGTAGDLPHGLCDLTVDGIARAARRCGVVGFVENQERARPELAEQAAQACDLG